MPEWLPNHKFMFGWRVAEAARGTQWFQKVDKLYKHSLQKCWPGASAILNSVNNNLKKSEMNGMAMSRRSVTLPLHCHVAAPAQTLRDISLYLTSARGPKSLFALKRHLF